MMPSTPRSRSSVIRSASIHGPDMDLQPRACAARRKARAVDHSGLACRPWDSGTWRQPGAARPARRACREPTAGSPDRHGRPPSRSRAARGASPRHPALRERADADPVPGARPRIRSTSGTSAGSALMSTFQRRRGNSSRRSSNSGSGSLPPTLACCTSLQGSSAIRPRASVTRSSRRVVEGDELAVPPWCAHRSPVAVAGAGGPPEGGRGVLEPVRRPAAMGEGERRGMVGYGWRAGAPPQYRLPRCPAGDGRAAAALPRDGEDAQEELGQRADGQRVQHRADPHRAAEHEAGRAPRPPRSPVRTSRIERPVRRCSPVIRPSRGPGPKRAEMYRPVAAPFSTMPASSSGMRQRRARARPGPARACASIARPTTKTLETVPRPGRCRASGSTAAARPRPR